MARNATTTASTTPMKPLNRIRATTDRHEGAGTA